MNRIDEWTQFISKCLKSETELLGLQAKHDIYEDAARATFIRVVLDQFLPGSFAVGSGRVIDSLGNSSGELDIVIYRRDFPQLNLPGNANVFLYESVLATFEVKTKVIRKTFFEALDSCASMAELEPAVNPVALRKLALRNKLKLNENSEYVHQVPLTTARFKLIGRPPSFVYAFSGYQTSLKQLKENIDLWIDYRRKKGLNYEMKSFPAVIATQGCFAWRNAAPFSMKKNVLLGLGNDSAPIRLVILQLMNALNRRLRGTNDSSGMNMNLDAYINDIDPPAITSSCGIVVNPGGTATTRKPTVKKDVAPPVKQAPVSVPAEEKTLPPLAEAIGISDPVEDKTVSKPEAIITEPTPVENEPVSTPAAKIAEPAPVEKEPVSAPVAKIAEPAPVEKEPVSAPVEEKSELDFTKLKTTPTFKPSVEIEPTTVKLPVRDPAMGTSPSADPEAVNNAQANDEPEMIEPELANPEFIEPEIIGPESVTEIDLDATPLPGSVSLEDTVRIPASEQEKMTASVPKGEAKSEPQLDKKPADDPDPFSQTLRLPAGELGKILPKTSAPEAKPELEDKPDPETDPFSETIRMPPHELEKIAKSAAAVVKSESARDSNSSAKNGQGHVTDSDPDPFNRTIPQ
ncbi:MAG: DUF6602 domain-containing protein [Gammaproteobacteria bacterium]